MGSKKQVETKTNSLPGWMDKNAQTLAGNAMATPASYTQQNRTAPTNNGYGAIGQGIERSRVNENTAPAAGALTSAYNANSAGRIAGPDFSQAALSKFGNPFQQDVIDGTVAEMERARQVAGVADRGRAAAASAFGGTRQAVQDAETNAGYDRNMFNAVANLRSAGFDKAVGQYNTDYGQQLQAGQFNNAAAGQNYNQGQNYATTLAGLGQQDVTNEAAANQAAFQLANAEMDRERGNIEARAEEGRYGQTYPLQAISTQANINGALAPALSTTTTTSPGPSVWGTLASAAGSAAGAYARSDERVKENIEDLNPEGVLGAFASIPTKSYDYKPEFAGPYKGRRDGFMAQDYARAFNEDSPVDHEGVKVVDIPQVMGRLVAAVKGLEARTRELKKGAA